jgi:hypothetical protein
MVRPRVFMACEINPLMMLALEFEPLAGLVDRSDYPDHAHPTDQRQDSFCHTSMWDDYFLSIHRMKVTEIMLSPRILSWPK